MKYLILLTVGTMSDGHMQKWSLWDSEEIAKEELEQEFLSHDGRDSWIEASCILMVKAVS